MKIIDLYKSILSTASLIVDQQNMVSASMRGTTVPFTVSGKRLVLPTPEHLCNPDKSGIYLFHPLSENILGGESVVMEKFRHAINTRLNYVLGSLMDALLVLGISVGEHAKMSPDQSELLALTKEADEKTLTQYRALLKAMGMGDKEKCIVHMFLKRGGKVGGKTYNRAVIVRFPLYEELIKKEKTVYGVSLRNRDRETLIKLLEFLIPGIEVAHHYDKGSESDIGPFLDALMRGLMPMASRINSVVETYKAFLDKPEELLYEDDWVEVFDNLAQLLPEIRAIPMQAGNQGPVEGKAPPVAVPSTPQFQVAPPAPVNPYPTPAPMSPVAPCQSTLAPSAPATTPSGGLDFHSILNKNPALAAMPVMGGMPPGFGMQAPMSGPQALRAGVPVWARPNLYPAPMQSYPGQGYPQAGFQQAPYPQAGGFGNV